MQGRAIVMRGYGGPHVLGLEEVELPELGADDVRIRALASAVNHSDLEIRAGNWPIRKPEPFPYVPGLETVGEVVAVGRKVDSVRPGARVTTMMQGLGGVRARRPGGYAEYVTVAAEAIATVPDALDPVAVAALGLASVTAFEGLARLGPLAGTRVLVTGASGGVGSACVGVARAQRAEVIAVVSRPERAAYVRSLGAAEVVVTSAGDLDEAIPSRSVDRVLDTVGGDLFRHCVRALRAGGGLCLVGAMAGSEVSLDAWSLPLPIILTGYASEALDGPSLQTAVDAICGFLARGELAAPAQRAIPLAEAAAAHELLERRGVEGRIVLVPGQ